MYTPSGPATLVVLGWTLVLEDECLLLLRWGIFSSPSTVLFIEVNKEPVQVVREVPVLTDLCGVAFIVGQGFNSPPHAPGVIVLKLSLHVLLISALGLSDAFFQVPSRQHCRPACLLI